jgi:Type II secretion system (T2SS), protein E, N-terminal domain
MNEISRPAWLPLGSLLLREGLVSPEQLELALLAQEQDRRRLGEILVEWGWVSSRAIAEALSEQYGIRFLDLEVTEVDEQAAAHLDEDLAEEYQALPIRFLPDGVLLVAVADPTDVGACDELREVISVPIRLVVVDAVVLTREIQRQRAGLRPV